MTQRCSCGGETYVDSFDWPKKPRQWFLRCEACRAMSASVATQEDASGLTVQWSVPPGEWKGKTVAVLASGSSMSQSLADQVRAEGLRAIVVNSTFRLAPWADLLYGADASWWKTTPGARQFAGMKVSCEPVKGVLNLRNAGKTGYSEDAGCVHTYGNSGAQAIQIAAKGGAARILLYGFDMRGGHWHGEHPKPLRSTSPGTFEKWIQGMEALAAELAKREIAVENRTPGSALKCFPSK
jgi:hypothetical protein